jgi:hypothetical protein
MNAKRLLFIAGVASLSAVLLIVVSWKPATALLRRAPQFAAAMGSGFSYQGYLEDGNAPANDNYDFQFDLYDADSGGTLIGTDFANSVIVSDGIFSANLDFGEGAFAGEPRWLAISVRNTAVGGAYTPLGGRQPVNPSPYALHAASIDDGAVTAEKIGEECAGGQVLAYTGQEWTCVSAALDYNPPQNITHTLSLDGVPLRSSVAGGGGGVFVDLETLGNARTPGPGKAAVDVFDIVCTQPCSEILDWHNDAVQQTGYQKDVTIDILDSSGSTVQTWSMLECWLAHLQGELGPDGSEMWLRAAVVCNNAILPVAGPECVRASATEPESRQAAMLERQDGVSRGPLPLQQVPHNLTINSIGFAPGAVRVDLAMLEIDTLVVDNSTGGCDHFILTAGSTSYANFEVVCLVDCPNLRAWYEEVFKNGGSSFENGALSILDDSATEIYSWTLQNCLPVALGAELSQDGAQLYEKYTLLCSSYTPMVTPP